MIVLYLLAAALVLFIAVLLIRTLRFTPKPQNYPAAAPVSFDRDAAVQSLAALLRCKTVSYDDPALENDAEFERLVSLLPELYPEVFRLCSLQRFDGRALLLRWPGRDGVEPAVMMSHYDVVPAEEENWDKPAFEGIIENGVLWGRGALDTKVTMNACLSAANALIGQGFQPAHDIYFAFSGGEEVNGPGAQHIVEYFKAQGITPGVVIDEGGAVVQDVFPGVSESCAMIGIAEKGMINMEYAIASNGGHASAPAPHTPVGRLSAACVRVENHPFPKHFTAPVRAMFDTLGRRSGFVYRMIFANLWCFGGVLDLICKRSGGELNALVRTTVAFTQMQGSSAHNVIPPSASMVSNIRLNPEDSVASAKAYLEKTVGDPEVHLNIISCNEPSRISRTDCDGWNRVASAAAATWPGCIVTPYLMVQCSDSRHYGAISDRVYRFSAMDLTSEERKTIHGNNERIRLETIERSVEFYIRVMQQC